MGDPVEQFDGFEFDFEGPGFPHAPGVPKKGGGLSCPTSLTVVLRKNLPEADPASGTSGDMAPSTVEVNVPSACEIVDVNMLLSIQHTWMGDLTVTLEAGRDVGDVQPDLRQHRTTRADAGQPVGGHSGHAVRRGHDER